MARKCASVPSARKLWISRGWEERKQHGSETERTISKGSRAGLGEGIQLHQRERRPTPAEDCGKHGSGGSDPERQAARFGRSRTGADHRAEACDYACTKVDCQFQVAEEH